MHLASDLVVLGDGVYSLQEAFLPLLTPRRAMIKSNDVERYDEARIEK